jgi:uncharacterized lipoprotein
MTDDGMVFVRRNILALLAALAASMLLGGCGFVHKHFGHKDTYQNSRQERPLEVPPDLDTPNSSGALVIPPAANAAAPGSAAAPSNAAAAPPEISTPPSAPPASVATGAGVSPEEGGLRVADTLESTWTRVGLALTNSGAATISSRDEAAHTYTVATTGQATTRPGWFKRAITLGHASGKTTAKVTLTVRVSADGAASTVSVEGATDDASRDAARTLLATLRQRLS